MKVEMTVPTEQYGNVRPTVEFPDDYSVEKVAEYTAINYRIFANAFKEKPESTLPEKEFSALIYTILHNTKDMDVEQWELCNPAQKTFLKLLKNAMLRKKPTKKEEPETPISDISETGNGAYGQD